MAFGHRDDLRSLQPGAYQGRGVVGGSFALNQFIGAMIGGILMVIIARIDYRRFRPLAWPLIMVTIFFLVIAVLPFTARISPPDQRRAALDPVPRSRSSPPSWPGSR